MKHIFSIFKCKFTDYGCPNFDKQYNFLQLQVKSNLTIIRFYGEGTGHPPSPGRMKIFDSKKFSGSLFISQKSVWPVVYNLKKTLPQGLGVSAFLGHEACTEDTRKLKISFIAICQTLSLWTSQHVLSNLAYY